MNFSAKIPALILIPLVFFLSSCETLNVSAIGTQGQFAKEADEERLWKRCMEEQEVLARSGFIYDNPSLNSYLSSLVSKLMPEDVKKTGVNVKVLVIKDPTINALMYPNGVMCVHTGLLANAENEAQLVSVLGHELTHFINRHSLKQFRNLKNKSAFFSTLSMISTSLSGLTGSPQDYSSLGLYNLISSVNGYSRTQEKEADTGGFDMLLRNNYYPSESVKVIEIFQQDEKDMKNKHRVPYAFQSHPSNKARIKTLKKLCKLHDSEFNDKSRITGEDSYNKHTVDLLLNNAAMDIKASRFNSAKRAVDRYLQLCPQDAKAYYCLGEIFCNRNEKDDQAKAIEHYKKSIDLDNDFPFAHRDLGLIYYKTKLSNEAKTEFEKYLALVPNAEDKKYITIYLDELRRGETK